MEPIPKVQADKAGFVRCPYCHNIHRHGGNGNGIASGHRLPDCGNRIGYIVVPFSELKIAGPQKCGYPSVPTVENKTDSIQIVELFSGKIQNISFGYSHAFLTYEQFISDIAKHPYKIGLIRLESDVPLPDGETLLVYSNPSYPNFIVDKGRKFKNEDNVWEYWCDIRLCSKAKLSFKMPAKSKFIISLFPNAEMKQK